MPVATLCAAAPSGSDRVPEPAIDFSIHVVSFVTLETKAIKDFEPAAAKTFPHSTKYRLTPDREAFNYKTLRLQIQPARYPQMRPQHHVQPLTTRAAPTASPKSMPISDTKNEPSGHSKVLLREQQTDQQMWKHFPVHCQILKRANVQLFQRRKQNL